MRFTATTRVLAFYYAAYRLLSDASVLQTLRTYTSSQIDITETGSSLIAIVLFLLATTDLIPLMEGNNKYFTTMSKLRVWFSALLGSGSYFEVIPFSSPLLTAYFGVELMAGLMIFTEETGAEPMSEGAEDEDEDDEPETEDDEPEEEYEAEYE